MGKQSPAERLFTLTCCLVAAQSFGVSKRQLLESVAGYEENKTQEARDRMFERDKDLLRIMGVRLEVIDGEGSDDPEATRYRLAKDSFEWPDGFELNSTHMQLLELAAKAWNHQSMSQVARSALTRMRAFGVAGGEETLQVVSPKLFAKDPNFSPIAEAIESGVQISFDYQKPGESVSTRTLTPVRMRFIAQQWLLLGQENGELKNFLLRRMASRVRLTDLPCQRVTPLEIAKAEADLSEYIESQRAVLEVRPNSEAWYHFGAEQELVEVSYMDRELFAEELIEFGSDVRIVGPTEFASYVTDQLRQVVAHHA